MNNNNKADNKSHLLFMWQVMVKRHEPSYAELAQLCMHAENTIEQVKEFLQIDMP